MRPGDYIVSFAHAQIGHFGTVTGFPLSAPKPQEFGKVGDNWANDGWLVPITWTPVAMPFRPKDNIDRIRSLLPEKYSPIQDTGNGNQAAYLTRIDDRLFSELEQLGGFARQQDETTLSGANEQTFIQEVEDQIQHGLLADISLDHTEIEAVIKARKGQGTFRRNLEKLEAQCRVTGLRDKRLLIACHIKPWRVCDTAAERLDGANGLLLAPHIDRLFDIELKTFHADGVIHISEDLDHHSKACLGMAAAEDRGVGAFSVEQERYLEYHHENVFIG